MIDPLSPKARRDQYGAKINRVHSPSLAYGVPFATVLLASLTPNLPIIAALPLIPPFGLMVFIAWQLVRPGIFPFWAAIPLGLFDDIFSGQPLGSAVLLWSLAMLVMDALETRFPWRGFIQDWLTASAIIAACILLGAMFAGIMPGLHLLTVIGPQVAISVLIFPLVAKLVAIADRLRLMRLKQIT